MMYYLHRVIGKLKHLYQEPQMVYLSFFFTLMLSWNTSNFINFDMKEVACSRFHGVWTPRDRAELIE